MEPKGLTNACYGRQKVIKKTLWFFIHSNSKEGAFTAVKRDVVL